MTTSISLFAGVRNKWMCNRSKNTFVMHCLCFTWFVHAGKAPPNLPPGVPPLLPNPYIMAPGLLHAYPVSSWQTHCLYKLSFLSALTRVCYIVYKVTLFLLCLSLRCTATMTYKCCRQEYRWWVLFCVKENNSCNKNIIHKPYFIAPCPVLKKQTMFFSLQDYYSIAPFATPTAALTGRDGNLTNNPYSGEPSHNCLLKAKLTVSSPQLAACWNCILFGDEGTVWIEWLSSQ